MSRGRRIRKRERNFVGVEGEGDQAFTVWLRGLCEDRKLNHYPEIVVAGGGDTRAVVEYALGERSRRGKLGGRYKAALIFLDADRLERDRAAGGDPEKVD